MRETKQYNVTFYRPPDAGECGPQEVYQTVTAASPTACDRAGKQIAKANGWRYIGRWDE